MYFIFIHIPVTNFCIYRLQAAKKSERTTFVNLFQDDIFEETYFDRVSIDLDFYFVNNCYYYCFVTVGTYTTKRNSRSFSRGKRLPRRSILSASRSSKEHVHFTSSG